MYDDDGSRNVSRRTLLRASAGVGAVSVLGAGQASASDPGGAQSWFDDRCPDATLEPSMGHCEGSNMDGCDDDHPETVALQTAVRDALAERYPDVSALVDAGFKPYFDTLNRDDDSWSHWINPDFIADDDILNPERPESVLVDNDSWRSIGVMFIATRDGEPVDPPAVYEDGDADGDATDDVIDGDADGDDDHDAHGGGRDEDDDHDGHGDHEGAPGRCFPWHYHAGLPGRFGWWYYRQAYEQDFANRGLGGLELPCRTPCMMHVWTIDHPDSVYAHGAPPPEYRDQEPAENSDLETDAEPGTDELNWDALPDDLVPKQRPDDLAALVPGL
ncbi:twin-arginine translocation signal domain-containing protein [Natronorubrum sp. FCH18a]|uniref:twin-arginine translocation signal domain-containing protein n=1 Tax=Natronorubrum sp. FCH18a TaxID=3447018 RepID=UPI003F518E64